MSFERPTCAPANISWPSVALLKAVIKELVGGADEPSGVARAWRPVLAKEYGVTERWISRILDALELLGYIERTRTTWRGKPWRALAFRIRVHAADRAEPTMTQRLAARVAELERQLAAEAHEALDALEGAEVIELAQRADSDDKRKTPVLETPARAGNRTTPEGIGSGVHSNGASAGTDKTTGAGRGGQREHAHEISPTEHDNGALVALWSLVMDGKLAKSDAPEGMRCPSKCQCGGRYRIRTCDFVRVKDAVTALPSHESDPQAVPVVAAIIRERKRKHGLAPRSLKQDAKFFDLLDPIVGDCLALAENHGCDYAAAVNVLVFTMYEYPGRDGKWAAEGHPLDWYPHNSPRVFELATQRMERRLAGNRPSAPPESTQDEPRACRGICAGGRFKNPTCDECEAIAANRARARAEDEQRARDREREATNDGARARDELAAWAAAEGA